MMANKHEDWCKPDSWPDIEAVLSQDVTPQAAIDAGATKKWIMLCNPGPPGGGATEYTFRNDSYMPVYVRVSDGLHTAEKAITSSDRSIEPLDYGRPFWIISYTSAADTRVPEPCFGPYNYSGQLWVHAPEHTFHDASHDTSGWKALARFVAGGIEIRTYNAMFYETASVRSFKIGRPPVFTSVNGATAFFQNCKTRRIDVSSWDFSSCASFSSMFKGCSSLVELALPDGMVKSNCNSLESMFDNCASLLELDLSSWDVSGVTNINNMFNSCSSMTKIDMSDWDTSHVSSTCRNLFSYCCALREIVGISSLRLPLVTNAGLMFTNTKVESLDLSNLFETSVCTSVDGMFSSCYYLKTLDISGWNCSSMTNWNNTFANCYALETIIGSKTVSSDGSVEGSTAYFGKGPKVSFKLDSSPLVGHDSLLYIMYWVPSVSGQTMTLGSANKAKLTASEIAIAEAKGWTVS